MSSEYLSIFELVRFFGLGVTPPPLMSLGSKKNVGITIIATLVRRSIVIMMSISFETTGFAHFGAVQGKETGRKPASANFAPGRHDAWIKLMRVS